MARPSSLSYLDQIGLGRLQSWSIRGGSAVLDQGLFSGGNFALNVLLGRWLAPAEYGAYSVAFAVFLFVSGFHNALLLEPMTVIGPARYPERLREFFAGQIKLHFLIAAPLGAVIALVGAALLAWSGWAPMLPRALVAAGCALPLMLLLWIVRRLFYVLQQPGRAMFVSAAYSVILLGGLWVVHRAGMDSSPTGFALMALASLISSLLAMLIWMDRNKLQQKLAPIAVGEILRAQWDYGKWLFATAILSLGAGQAQTFITAGMISLEAAGVLRAMQNFILPMSQAVTALATLGLPALSFEFGRRGIRALRRKGLIITIGLTLLTLAYELILWLFGAPLESYLYQARYANYAWLLPVLGLIPVLTAIATGYSLILRSIQKPQHYLIAGLVTAPAALISGYLFTLWWGVEGTMISLVFTSATQLIMAYVLYRYLFPFAEIQ